MLPRVVSIAAGVTPELHADPCTFVRAAEAAGWSACGVWFDPASWTVTTTREIRRCLDESGMTPVDIEVVRMGQADDYGEAIVDTAAELGVPNVLAISSFDDRAATADRLAHLCERAAPADIRVCLEFMRFTTVRNLDDALAVLRLADQPNAGILLDLLHVHRSGTTYDQIHAVDQHLFPYAQWCDGPAEPHGWDTASLITDALDDRCIPGEGELETAGFVALLAPVVPLSLEVRSRALREAFPDPTARAAHLLAGTRAALDQERSHP